MNKLIEKQARRHGLVVATHKPDRLNLYRFGPAAEHGSCADFHALDSGTQCAGEREAHVFLNAISYAEDWGLRR